MASERLAANPAIATSRSPSNAKRYGRTKLLTGVVSSILSFAFLVTLVASGYSTVIESVCHSIAANEYVRSTLFVSIVGTLQVLITLPLSFFSGYYIEHQYQLSNQSVGGWFWERVKGMFIGIPIALALVLVLFYCMRAYGGLWWLPVSFVVVALTVFLARIGPILIMPMFYRFTPIGQGQLRERILRLCNSAGLRIEGIFSFDMSKNTRKANAGFTGVGKSRRIVLGDTLMKEFTEEEIETVFAHELGHYRYHHIPISMLIGSASVFVGLFATARLYEWSLAITGFSGITDLAAFPLLALWLSLYGLVTSPLGNIVSRRHERQADTYAVRATGNAQAFISALRKLAATNLADPEPHPIIEYLFYSHPSIAKRIRLVQSVGG